MNINERAYLTKTTGDLIGAMVVRNGPLAMDAIDKLSNDRFKGRGVLFACTTAAEITRKICYPDIPRGDGTLSGPLLGIEQNPNVEVAPKNLWAARFLAAHVNGDEATLTALYYGCIDDVQLHAGGVISLLAMCADVIREDMEQHPEDSR